MILLIDIGNQRIKWGFLLENGFHFLGACHYKQEQDLPSLLSQHFSGVPRPQEIYIASVASRDFTQQVSACLSAKWRIPVQQLGVQALPELEIAYTEPAQFGVDRWLALLGAMEEQAENCLVVDCGTCVSFDAISARGVHQGGLLLPGLQLMRASILQGTARCVVDASASVSDNQPSLLGSNTRDGIERGTLFALLATISQLKNELSQEFNHEFTVFLTGGDAALLLPFIEIPVLYRPYLVFEGMVHLLGKKKKSKFTLINSSLTFELNTDCE